MMPWTRTRPAHRSLATGAATDCSIPGYLIVRLLLGALFALVIGASSGLGATWFALNQGAAFGAIRIGAWMAWPKTGTPDIDPYGRATIARSGQLPVASGDGIAFFSRHDDQGQPLDGRCDIVLRGTTPAARFWTLTLYDTDGRLVANSLNRYNFTSEEVTRYQDGSFEITVSARARPGNWLPTGGADRIVLELRLYDTPVGSGMRIGREVIMPSISEEACP